jgi:hypothetical protein
MIPNKQKDGNEVLTQTSLHHIFDLQSYSCEESSSSH